MRIKKTTLKRWVYAIAFSALGIFAFLNDWQLVLLCDWLDLGSIMVRESSCERYVGNPFINTLAYGIALYISLGFYHAGYDK